MNSITDVLSRMNNLESRFRNLFSRDNRTIEDSSNQDSFNLATQKSVANGEAKSEASFAAQLQALQMGGTGSASIAGVANDMSSNNIPSLGNDFLSGQSTAFLKNQNSLSASKNNFSNNFLNGDTFSKALQAINSKSTIAATSPVAALTSSPKLSLDDMIENAAKQHNLPPELIRAIAKVESNFDEKAVSPKGAMGIMQIMPQTAKDLDLDAPFVAEKSLNAGAKLMRRLLDTYKNDLVKALAAYNAGETVVNAKGVPNYPETKNYVKKVIDNYLKYNGVER